MKDLSPYMDTLALYYTAGYPLITNAQNNLPFIPAVRLNTILTSLGRCDPLHYKDYYFTHILFTTVYTAKTKQQFIRLGEQKQ